MIKNLVFDFDGTIADSKDEILRIIEESAVKYGYSRLAKDKGEMLRSGGAAQLISALKIPDKQILILMQDIKDGLSGSVENFRTYQGISETLNKLKDRKIKLGILTTNSKSNVVRFLKKNQIDIFDFIYHGSSLFGKDKMLLKMLREKNLIDTETAYVGDEDRDIVAAKNAGIIPVAVSWGFNSEVLLQRNKPAFLLKSPPELLDVVK